MKATTVYLFDWIFTCSILLVGYVVGIIGFIPGQIVLSAAAIALIIVCSTTFIVKGLIKVRESKCQS